MEPRDGLGAKVREEAKTEEHKREAVGLKDRGTLYEHLRLTDVLSEKKNGEIPFNTEGSIAFENDNFVGKVIFKVRPNEESELPESYKDYFKKYIRKFSLQVQGRIKKRLSGPVYLGGELGRSPDTPESRPMSIGFMQKGFSRLCLSTISLLRSGLHYSLGDSEQEPHIVLPLYSVSDTFLETDEKDAPSMGVEMFDEDEKSVKKRRRSKIKNIPEMSPDKVYSFSLHNHNLDLFNWKVEGIPGMKPMQLSKYWQNRPFRISAYVHSESPSRPHTDATKKYLFCFQLVNKRSSNSFRSRT
mmetsp:Transcript_12732/g.19070  ORF Transcript_12732/g.19070 Transcript_12732/m.19070 type:complete len:300 (+) Transcript_12732:97-996(+)